MLMCVLIAGAEKIKINYKADQMPYTFKFKKFEVKDGVSKLYGEVTQKGRFSYSISFSDITLTPAGMEPVEGKLVVWNDETRFSPGPRVIHNDESDSFVIEFPTTSIGKAQKFDLRLGTIENKEKTEIYFKDIPNRK